MPEVVADTSPIQYLFQAGLLDLLPRLYRSVVIPEAVVQELEAGRARGIQLPEPGVLPWLVPRAAPHQRLLRLATGLGRGEREVLTLAAELSEPLALLDDALARRHARLLGIPFTGTLGVLLRAKSAGELTEVAPAVNQLESLGFRLDASTRMAILAIAGEVSG